MQPAEIKPCDHDHFFPHRSITATAASPTPETDPLSPYSPSSPSARPRVPHWGFDKCLGFNDQVKWCHGRHDDDATQLAPHTKDKGGGGGRPLWGGGGGLQRWRWRGSWPHHREGEGREEGRISPIHHKKSRNLMSNFAQHRVRPHSHSPSSILSKVKNQSLFKLRSCSRGEEGERRFVSGQTLSFRRRR